MWISAEALPAVDDSIISDDSIGPYTVGQLLGKGEFASVYSCVDESGAEYAIKCIDKANLVNARKLTRTIRRIRRVGSEITAMHVLRNL